MSLESFLAAHFKHMGWHWKLKKGTMVPDEEDFLEVLDEAAKTLYNEPVGAELHVGRLIIKKKHRGFDVYVFVGPYE